MRLEILDKIYEGSGPKTQFGGQDSVEKSRIGCALQRDNKPEPPFVEPDRPCQIVATNLFEKQVALDFPKQMEKLSGDLKL